MIRNVFSARIHPRVYWLKNWAITLLGLVAAQGGNALALIVLARRVEPTAYGRYLASYTLANLLMALPGLGLDRWLLTRGGAERNSAGHLWRAVMRLRLAALGLWLVGMGTFAVLQRNDALPPLLLLLAALSLAFDSLTSLAYTALRCEGQHAKIMVAQSFAALFLLGIALMLPKAPEALLGFALMRVLLSLGVSGAIISSVSAYYGARQRTAVEGRTPFSFHYILRNALPFLISDLAISVYMRADLSIVSLALESVGAAVYGPALNLINVCFLVPFAFNILMLPRLSRAYVESPQTFWQLGRSQLMVQIAAGALMSLGVWGASGSLVNLAFGKGYTASATVLRLLSPLIMLKACNFGLGNILTAADRQVQRTVIQIAAAGFNVLANLLVVHPYGVPGVAVVYLMSELFLCAGYAMMLRTNRASVLRFPNR